MGKKSKRRMETKPVEQPSKSAVGVERDYKLILAAAAAIAILLIFIFAKLQPLKQVIAPEVQPTSAPTLIPTPVISATPVPTIRPTAVAKPAALNPVLVEIRDFAFRPSNVSVEVGQLVIWKNADTILYTVKSDDGELNSPTIGKDMEFNHSFSKPGAWKYYDALHPGPVGYVYVTG